MGSRSWGLELWDQPDEILKYSNSGLNQVDQAQRCLNELSKIHSKCAEMHKKVVDRYKSKAKNNDTEEYTSSLAFNELLLAIGRIGSVHEQFADAVKKDVNGDLKPLYDDMKKKVDEQKKDSERLRAKLRQQQQLLQNVYKKYSQCHKDMIKALDAYSKAEEDKTLAREQVDKVKAQSELRRIEFDRSKAEYASALQNFNHYQQKYYSKDVPDWATHCELMDRDRLVKSRDVIQRVSGIERESLTQLEECYRMMETAAGKISVDEDSRILVSAYSSRKPYPGDIHFVDLEKGSPTGSMDSVPSGNSSFIDVFHSRSSKGKGKLKNKWFGSKTPKDSENDMSKDEIKKRADDTKEAIAKAKHEMDALVRLQDTYRLKPSLGDPNKIQPEIEVFERRIETLNKNLQDYERQLNGFGDGKFSGGHPSPSSTMTPKANSDDDLESIEDNRPSLGAPSANQRGPSSVAGNGAQPVSAVDHSAPQAADNPVATDQKTYVGSCTALYSFEGEDTDGEFLTMRENDQFYVLEADEVSGWTLVETLDGSREGYIPTSYVEMQFY